MTRILLVIAACLLAPHAAMAQAQQPPTPATPLTGDSPFEGVFRVGGTGTDTDGNPARAGEYQILKDALADIAFQVWGERGTSRFDIAAVYGGDKATQRYRADVNVNRRVKAFVGYERLPHRLDHDPLTWMSAASNIGGGPFVVRATDYDPTAEYALTRSELQARVEFTAPLPRAGALKFFVGHRQEFREGSHQALTSSHCEACHTESFTRKIDQSTRDLIAGTKLQAGRLAVEYSYTNRKFGDDAATPVNIYDRALHPGSRLDVFLNRVSYDERSGALPFDTVPGLQKDTHSLKANVALPADAHLYGSFVQSTSRNLDTELETAITGAATRISVPIGKNAVLRGALQRFDIDSDSVFVDIGEPVAPAGPAAGLTYEQAYPTLGELDFVRESSLSRTPTLARMEFIYRAPRRTTFRLGYDWEEVTRDHFEVHKTTTNTARVSARGTPDKHLTWQARLTYDWITDPFMGERAAVPAVLQPFMSPGNVPFTGIQYFEMYRSRQANLSSFPTSRALFEPSVTWSPGDRVSLSAYYRYKDAQNDDLNFSTWTQALHAPGAQLWVAPTDHVTFHAGYTFQRERTETLVSTLAFVG